MVVDRELVAERPRAAPGSASRRRTGGSAVHLRVGEGARAQRLPKAGLAVGLQAAEELEVPVGGNSALGAAPLRGNDRGHPGSRTGGPAEVALGRAVQMVGLLRQEVVLRLA